MVGTLRGTLPQWSWERYKSQTKKIKPSVCLTEQICLSNPVSSQPSQSPFFISTWASGHLTSTVAGCWPTTLPTPVCLSAQPGPLALTGHSTCFSAPTHPDLAVLTLPNPHPRAKLKIYEQMENCGLEINGLEGQVGGDRVPRYGFC